MKLQIISLLGIILGGCSFIAIKPAAEPMAVKANLEPLDMNPYPFYMAEIEELNSGGLDLEGGLRGGLMAAEGPQTQRIINWFEAKLAQKEQQIGTLKNTPEWRAIKTNWLAIKSKFENVFQLLAQRFEIQEKANAGQLTEVQAQEQLNQIFHNILNWNSPVRPSTKELDALIHDIRYFGTEKREQQPLVQGALPVVKSEVVQATSGDLPPVIDKQKQVIEDRFRKLESAVKEFEDYYRSHVAGDKYWFFQRGLSGQAIDDYWKTLELLFNQKNDIVKFIGNARNELKSSDQEKITELAKKIDLYQEQLGQIRKNIGAAYDKLASLWTK